MRRSSNPCAPLACALALAACSGSSEPVLLDAGSDASDARCLIPGSYGALGSKTGTPDSPAPSSLTVVLDPGPPRDVFYIQLVGGKGVFTGGVAAGTFAISGADARFDDCGLCVNVIADIVTGQGPSKFYFAQSGMVTITSTNAVAGSAQDLQLVEVDAFTGAPVPGGCATSITSIAFGP
jgi:hypothetical protein